MPLITHALLYAGYALVSLMVGLGLVQVGGATGAEAILSGAALFCAFAITHGGIAALAAAGRVSGVERRLRGDMDRLRAAHREIIADIDAASARLEAMDRRVGELAEAPAIAAQPPDLTLIDHIVDKLARAVDSRIEEARRVAPPAAERRLTRGPIDIVREALSDNRVELHLQPIVALPQRKTAFYEGFTRLKDEGGRLVLPQEFMPAAEQAGLMTLIDNSLTFRCVQIVRKLIKQDRRIGIFCNLTPSALADEHFFGQFLDFMRDNRDLAGAVIFEIPYAAFEGRAGTEARAMAKLADLGFRFSIDKVARVDVDLPDLERSGVRYLKVPGWTLVDQLAREGVRPRSAITRDIEAGDVAAVCCRYGVDLIAERVENEDVVVELLDLNVPFAQGHLFGSPRAIKDSLMEETAPPPGFFTLGRSAVA
jgi:cyclic-di-GMP phosphodiesterase TipF (flagellum assembly factor)